VLKTRLREIYADYTLPTARDQTAAG